MVLHNEQVLSGIHMADDDDSDEYESGDDEEEEEEESDEEGEDEDDDDEDEYEDEDDDEDDDDDDDDDEEEDEEEDDEDESYEDDDDGEEEESEEDDEDEDDEDDEEYEQDGFEDEDTEDMQANLVPYGSRGEDMPDDEPEYERKGVDDEKKRLMYVLALICCCCCIIILVVVLVVVLGGKDDKDDSPIPSVTSAPVSSPPTISPSPTSSPTLYPQQIFLPIVADTYLKSGAFGDQSFGTEDRFEVLNDQPDTDAYALLQFDLSELPPQGDLRDSEIILRLNHIETILAGTTSEILVSKIPYDSSLDVESLTYNSYTPFDSTRGPTFTVSPDTTSIDIDITDMIRFRRPGLVRGRRNTQERGLLLQLRSNGEDNRLGQLFRTREAGEDFAPLLIHNFNTDSPTQSPSGSIAPSASPTGGPTVTARPTVSSMPSNNPTTTVQPSSAPTITAQPSSSSMPSNTPSISPQPSVSAEPSVSPRPTPCSDQTTLLAYSTAGAGADVNPLPEGAITYISQDSTSVTVRIRQLWSDESVVWIATNYFDADQTLVCPKTRNIAGGDSFDVEVPCPGRDIAILNLLVNDDSLLAGPDLNLENGCVPDDDDIFGKKQVYGFELKCQPFLDCI